jgi:hypothetical protein
MSEIIRRYRGPMVRLKWDPQSEQGRKLKIGPMEPYPSESEPPPPPKVDGIPPVPGDHRSDNKKGRLA